MTAPLPGNEAERLQALWRYDILDTPPEAAFDRITRLAAALFEVPIVLVSLVDRERQWFKSCYGVDIRETARELSFCAYTILSDEVVIAPDTTRDARFASNDMVTGGPRVRFYAGAPLRTHDGHNLGSLCLIDMKPRTLDENKSTLLRDMAALVVDQLELRQTGQRLRDEVRERSETEAALLQARAEAEDASRAKSEFLSRTSHELRTPMNAILGFGQLLEMDDLESEQAENVAHILKAGRHLLELINEVLDIARIEADRLALSLEPVSVSDVVDETCEIMRGLATQRQIRLDAHLGVHEKHYVVADRQRLKQVLLNLIANAVKYNQMGGSVLLDCEEVEAHPKGQSEDQSEDEGGTESARRLRLKVRDTGPGLSPEQREKLFLPFERVGSEYGPIEGTGLGLALSKRLAEAMGGRIGVSSESGQGSTFWVEFPLATPPQARLDALLESADAPPIAPPQQTRAVVLYVEDNLSNLSLVQRVMQQRPGVRLLPAMQGRRGLELAREHQPHLILLDLHLPDINGDEVLRYLQADPRTRDIPVILISADATPFQIERMLAAGAHKYLTKPLDIAEFLLALDEGLDRNREDSRL